MHISVVLLFAVVFFEGQLLSIGSAIPPAPINPPEPDSLETPGNNVVEGAGVTVSKKKFVPALFFKTGQPQYKFTTNWFQAYQYCRYHGMHLASPESPDEEKQLISVMEKRFNMADLRNGMWTSGNDLAIEGNFVWMSSGKTMTYQNWWENEPNNHLEEDCVDLSFYPPRGYYWNDGNCARNLHFACEYYENSVDKDNLTPEGKQFVTEYV